MILATGDGSVDRGFVLGASLEAIDKVGCLIYNVDRLYGE